LAEISSSQYLDDTVSFDRVLSMYPPKYMHANIFAETETIDSVSSRYWQCITVVLAAYNPCIGSLANILLIVFVLTAKYLAQSLVFASSPDKTCSSAQVCKKIENEEITLLT
jgi:hypothetical protein